MASRRVVLGGLAMLALTPIALVAWYLSSPGDEGAIKRQLRALADEANASTVDGLGTAARAVALGSYFTDDVHVDLGQGTAAIQGRETVIGMATRLQPRTAAFQLKLDDVSVSVAPDGETAEVHLTAEFIRRSISTSEQSMDAREFALGMRKVVGDWKIGRVTAVATLK